MKYFLSSLKESVRDLASVILVIAFFQLVVLQQPLPNPYKIFIGLVAVILGLALFVRGLNLSLFPIGETIGADMVHRGSIVWLSLFAFALGFGTTLIEPALIAVADEAAKIRTAESIIMHSALAEASYATGLRFTVALSVGLSLVLGVFRILKGWPIHWIIMGGYLVIVILTQFAPKEIIGIAYDSGGVTTSTITVPLVTALGIGLSVVIKGRNPLIDGFGLIAFASMFPIPFVLIYGMMF